MEEENLCGGKMKSDMEAAKTTRILIFIILLFAVFIRWYYFFGIDFDGAQYTLQAKHIADGIYDPIDINLHNQGIRYGMLLPIAFMYMIFGVSDFSSFAFQFFISIVQIILIYFFGKELFNSNVGILAAFLLAIFPLDVNNATILEADLALSFFSLVSILFLYFAIKKERSILYFLSGLFFAIALNTKIFAVLLLPLYFFMLMAPSQEKKMRKSNILLFSGGVFSIFIPVMIYFLFTTGDSFYFYTIEKQVNDFLLDTNILDFFYYPKYMLLMQPYNEVPMFSLYFLFLPLALLYFLWKRQKQTDMLFIWLIPVLLTLLLIPSIPKVQRYMLFIEVPLILFLSHFFYTIYHTFAPFKWKKSSCILFLAFFFLISCSQYGGYTVFDKETMVLGKNIQHKENAYSLVLYEEIPDNIYVMNYNQIPLLSYFLKYQYNSSLPFGYRGPAKYSFYDLHFIDSVNDVPKGSYMILDMNFFLEDQDKFSYYGEYNGSLTLIKEQFEDHGFPSHWHGLYGFLTKENKVAAGVYVVK